MLQEGDLAREAALEQRAVDAGVREVAVPLHPQLGARGASDEQAHHERDGAGQSSHGPRIRRVAVIGITLPVVPMLCDILLVAAFPPELERLEATLGGGLSAEVHGMRVVARAVGIGIVSAAVGTTSVLREVAPRAVVFIGTCGGYAVEGAPRIGEVAVAREAVLVDPTCVEDRAAIPEAMTLRLPSGQALQDGLTRGGAVSVAVATTLAITTDDDLARVISRASGCLVEHLEAFAVASACQSAGVPFGAVLGVANVVGGRAREEWLRHHRAAASAAALHVLEWVGAGAPGLGQRG